MAKLFDAMHWRNIGPHRGGRSVAVAGHPHDLTTFYMGSTGGGVWKTRNAGITWQNVSDGFFRTSSVGAIAVAPSDPEVIYAGMGEACIRGNVSPGDGVYRSADGGKTWSHLGLADTHHISRIRVHPTNPDWVMVAALGHAFGPNEERGIYRSTDGGQHFDRVLARSENTGAIDLAMDPNNPRILFAALWQVRRKPWALEGGGPESGLWRSADGGTTWTDISHAPGLPDDEVLGRIGVSVSRAFPNRVYAIVESKQGALFRSDDGGGHFERCSDAAGLRTRPWYYSHVFADPVDPDTVFVLNSTFFKSADAGKTFTPVATPHGDHHDLWIDPQNAQRMIHGADGGAAVSLDGGRSWSSIHNQPTAEFYHVTADTRFPYRVYGAQQDNTTISVPSRSDLVALSQREWRDEGGAESGYIQVRADNPDIVYAGSSGGGEGGRITRVNHKSGQQKDVSPWPERTAGMAAAEYTHRFQWTSPILLSPHDPNTLYVAGNRIFRSRDQGQSYDIISKDLTRGAPETLQPSGGPITKDHTGVEVYGTVFALAESPVRPGLLWAGTDDGRVHVSQDGGGQWREVTPAAFQPWTLVSIIEPSPHDPGTAYLAATRYKLDDFTPYLYRTTDLGATWTLITDGILPTHYTRVVRADPERPGLLYCGTERGVYVSFDDGGHWEPLQLDLPIVPIHDLAVASGDLVAATHGRSFWILDDLSPLRAVQADADQSQPRLFAPRPTYRLPGKAGLWINDEVPLDRPAASMEWPTASVFYTVRRGESGEQPVLADAGQNHPDGAILMYWLPEPASGTVTLRIRDAAGAEVRTYSSTSDKPKEPKPATGAGSHRLIWDLRGQPVPPIPGTDDKDWNTVAPLMPPGRYTAELVLEGDPPQVLTAPLVLLADPREPDVSAADFAAQHQLTQALCADLAHLRRTVGGIRRQKAQMDAWCERLKDHEASPALSQARDAAKAALEAVEGQLVQIQSKTADDDLQYAHRIDMQLAYLVYVAESGDGAPTAQTLAAHAMWRERAEAQYQQLSLVESGPVAAFQAAVRALDLPPLDALASE